MVKEGKLLAIVTVSITKAITKSILGAISTTDLINDILRVPKRIKKRRLGRTIDVYSTGTVTEHYLNLLKAILDEIYKYPEMQGYYLVMDDASIHSSTNIGMYIHLPPYFSGLNSIKQSWSVVKSKVKRNRFLEKGSLMTRTSEMYDSLYLTDFIGFVSHYAKCIGKCPNKERL